MSLSRQLAKYDFPSQIALVLLTKEQEFSYPFLMFIS